MTDRLDPTSLPIFGATPPTETPQPTETPLPTPEPTSTPEPTPEPTPLPTEAPLPTSTPEQGIIEPIDITPFPTQSN